MDGLTVGDGYAKRMNSSSAGTNSTQKFKEPMRTLVFDFSSARPPMNAIDPEEATTIKRILGKYPCDIDGGRIRIHPKLKVTLKELVILQKYLIKKGYNAAKNAVAKLNVMKKHACRKINCNNVTIILSA